MPGDPFQHSLRVSIIGLLVNGALGVVKLLAGLFGNSAALVADAVESLTDLLGSGVTWSGLHIAALPADKDHPYGHGRAETLAALVVTTMLVGAALAIATKAIAGLFEPQPVPASFTLWVLAAVVVVKEAMFRYARRAARETNSSVVLADAWHHRSDALTSLAAAVGIGVALIGGPPYAAADEWAALFAAGVIVFNAWHIATPSLRELMEAEQPKIVEQVRHAAERVPGVAGVEKVFARKHGLRFRVDMHVEVDPALTVLRAHEIAHGVKDAIRLAFPHVEDVLIHVEPHLPASVRADLTASPHSDAPEATRSGTPER